MEKYKIAYLGDLRVSCTHSSGAMIETDAPKDNEGKGELFSPTDLVALALGSCMLTVMAIAARRLGVDLKGTTVEVQKEMSNNAPRRIQRIYVCFRSPGHFSPSIQGKLEQAALECPVHYSLSSEVRQEFDFIWGE